MRARASAIADSACCSSMRRSRSGDIRSEKLAYRLQSPYLRLASFDLRAPCYAWRTLAQDAAHSLRTFDIGQQLAMSEPGGSPEASRQVSRMVGSPGFEPGTNRL